MSRSDLNINTGLVNAAATDVNTLEWRPAQTDRPECLLLINQLLLPHHFEMVECYTYREVGEAIRTMQVRGAPAIGVSAAYGMALAARRSQAANSAELLADLEEASAFLAATRPTAVNLSWALQRSLQKARELAEAGATPAEIGQQLLDYAIETHQEDLEANRRMGQFGAALIKDGDNVLTHCNAGGLATAGYGTAVGVIRAAHEAGKQIHVWVDETRPYLQGARLTAWEFQQLGIPLTLITDNMAGHLMQRGKVQFVVTGADRIAANGDTANKIGTYSLAVLAHENNIPFYIAAPLSTIDLTLPDGSGIPIEERSTDEVTVIGGKRIAPEGVHAAHPAFDVTPARYIHGIITERGIARPPFQDSIKALFQEV
ncbi:MAG TPA: S-methyl-5-thioribose-1-phosphate isomerase [Chloroflexia bacterium]|nr:S-methyl-5-thioribose-1-phosphate isomerase [Chloroflexia bacterium]